MSRNDFLSGNPNANRHSRRRLRVETKESSIAAFIKSQSTTFASKFVPSKSGGLMAAIRVDNRVVFPDSKGPQPKNDNKPYRFQIVAENPKGTVYFARIIGDEVVAPFKVVIQKSGKMVCVGCKPLMRFRPSKPVDSPLGEFRCATPTSSFEPRDDDEFDINNIEDSRPDNDFDDWRKYNDDYRAAQAHHDCGGRDCCHDGDDDEDDEREEESAFEQEVNPIYDALPTRIKNCHACGFDECRCDGTSSDWVPYRTTLRVIE